MPGDPVDVKFSAAEDVSESAPAMEGAMSFTLDSIYNQKADSFLNGVDYKVERTRSYRFGGIISDARSNVNEKSSADFQ